MCSDYITGSDADEAECKPALFPRYSFMDAVVRDVLTRDGSPMATKLRAIPGVTLGDGRDSRWATDATEYYLFALQLNKLSGWSPPDPDDRWRALRSTIGKWAHPALSYPLNCIPPHKAFLSNVQQWLDASAYDVSRCNSFVELFLLAYLARVRAMTAAEYDE